MTDWNTIERIRTAESAAARLGFKMAKSRYSGSGLTHYHSSLCLIPLDEDSVPVYSRDAEVFVGTLEELEVWIAGVEWARRYDCMMKLSSEKKREKAEQNFRNQKLLNTLKTGNVDPGVTD